MSLVAVGLWTDYLVALYVFLVISVLLFYLLYLFASSREIQEGERSELARSELRLAHISRLLSASDVQFLLQEPQSRKRLLQEFALSLRKDVGEIIRSKPLGFTAVGLVVLFYLGYGVIRLKMAVKGSERDLRFLSGLEISLFRMTG